MDTEVSVILATYNEKDNIGKLIERIEETLEGYFFEVIVVDDNSPDGTAQYVKEKFGNKENIKVIKRIRRGLATALLSGIEESKGEVIVLMDTDFSHPPQQIKELVKIAQDKGVANASRFVESGKFKMKAYRVLGTRFVELFARIILGVKVTDFTNGYVAVRKDILDKLPKGKIFYGYGDYCIRMFYYISKKGIKIPEIPTIYLPREKGESKTKEFSVGLDYLKAILRLRFKH